MGIICTLTAGNKWFAGCPNIELDFLQVHPSAERRADSGRPVQRLRETPNINLEFLCVKSETQCIVNQRTRTICIK